MEATKWFLTLLGALSLLRLRRCGGYEIDPALQAWLDRKDPRPYGMAARPDATRALGAYGGTLRWSEEGQHLVFNYIDKLQNPPHCEDVQWLEAMPLDGTHGLGASIHNVIKGAAMVGPCGPRSAAEVVDASGVL
eukprot:scaffold307_cov390-Prasinococcus_capsulatus_cf.AAC.29